MNSPPSKDWSKPPSKPPTSNGPTRVRVGGQCQRNQAFFLLGGTLAVQGDEAGEEFLLQVFPWRGVSLSACTARVFLPGAYPALGETPLQ